MRSDAEGKHVDQGLFIVISAPASYIFIFDEEDNPIKGGEY